MTDRQKISNAFRELRKMGWFARMNFWCCQSCGCAAVPESFKDKFVFYHRQDAEAIGVDGNIGGPTRDNYRRYRDDKDVCMYLTHGEGGDTNEVVSILKKHGLDAVWNGNMNTRIMIRHKA